jgi:hypothetical protein
MMKRERPVEARPTNLFAIAGFIAAMCGVVLLPVILGPVGLVLGAVGWRRWRQGVSGGRAFAILALILGGVETLLTIIALAAHYG